MVGGPTDQVPFPRVNAIALPRLQGPVVLEPRVFPDERGFFCETYREEWHPSAGLPPQERFIQDNHSRSTRGVVRGMHFHIGAGVAKLVRCSRGRILDVIVDLRRGSPTYAQWEGVELDDDGMRVLYVPVGFAHGFCVLSDVADVLYKQTAYYDPASSAASPGTTPTSGSSGPPRSSPSSPPATPPPPRCARSRTNCRSCTRTEGAVLKR